MLKNPQNLDLLFHFRFINDFRRDPLPKKDLKTDPFLGFWSVSGSRYAQNRRQKSKMRQNIENLRIFQH